MLEELERDKRENQLTYRKVLAYGLIAGASVTEMARMQPGLICDLFVLRRQYDDVMHQIRRG